MRQWLTWKSAGWVLATIILPAVISAYGPEIRRILEAARYKPRRWMLTRLKYQLALLERLHNSSYNLLLHFIWNIIWCLESMIGFLVVAGIIRLFRPTFPVTFPVIILSAIIGRVWALRDTVYALYDYDKQVTALKAAIEKMEADARPKAATAS